MPSHGIIEGIEPDTRHPICTCRIGDASLICPGGASHVVSGILAALGADLAAIPRFARGASADCFTSGAAIATLAPARRRSVAVLSREVSRPRSGFLSADRIANDIQERGDGKLRPRGY